MILYYETEDGTLYHHGVKGMRWGKRKAKYEYKYAYGQKPKTAYQKAMRSLGGTKLAKKAINSSNMSESQKKKALKEHEILADEKAYNKAAKKAHKTGGQMTYDVATRKYSVDKPSIKDRMSARKARIEAADKAHQNTLNKYYKNNDVNYSIDRINYGKKGVERISKRMDKGLSSFTAHQIEGGRQAAMAALNTVGLFAAVGTAAIVKDKISGR